MLLRFWDVTIELKMENILKYARTKQNVYFDGSAVAFFIVHLLERKTR